jgi:hypothetical protein
MANKRQRAIKAAIRKAKDHFHGKACDTARKPPRQPRDRDGKLRTLSGKRTLDRRITGGFIQVYA